MTNPVVVVGGAAISAGAAPLLRGLAVERRVGMLNTFAAKGLFAWDDPAHLGTIGLQEDDLRLAGLGNAEVLLVGVPDDEIGRRWLASVGARWREVSAADLAEQLAGNDVPTPRPALYDTLAAVCRPMYASAGVPINPARAAADLAAWLPQGCVVQARRDSAGFWLGRTFPTRELGSVRFHPPGNGARATVHVIGGRAPDDLAEDDIVEVWSADGPRLGPQQRLERLREAVEDGRGAVLPLGVDDAALAALVAVAGRPLWPRPTI